MGYSMMMMGSGGTTIMLKRIPKQYTRSMLIDRLNRQFKGSFDFLYLPPDSSDNTNIGHAFINFRTPQWAAQFGSMFNGVKTSICLPGFGDKNVAEVVLARPQSLEKKLDK